MKNGQKITLISKSSAYNGYSGIAQEYTPDGFSFYIKGETSTLIVNNSSLKEGEIFESGLTKGKQCDCCGIIPFNLYFNSDHLPPTFTCKDCNVIGVKITFFKALKRTVRHLMFPYKGFSC